MPSHIRPSEETLEESLLNRIPCVPWMLAWFTCPRVNVSMCHKCGNFSFLCANMPTSQRRANVSTCRAKCQFFNFVCKKPYQFFKCFSKEFSNFWIFQPCLTFAYFINIWVILENLSREARNLFSDICRFHYGKTLSS